MQVDLIDDGNEFEVVFKRKVDVCKRLRLHALRRVHHDERALARGERATDFVREIDVPGRIDEVELVFIAVERGIEHSHGREFDGDAPLAFDIHRIEELFLHIALAHLSGKLHDAVGNRALPVVDVRDDAEIA